MMPWRKHTTPPFHFPPCLKHFLSFLPSTFIIQQPPCYNINIIPLSVLCALTQLATPRSLYKILIL
jgi:hypothetical protein